MSQDRSTPPQWISMREAAAYIGVTERTVRRYVSDGTLPAHRVGGKRIVRIDRSAVDAILRPIPTTGGGR